MKNAVKLSRFIACVLRHKPDVAGIELNKYGWADVKELLDGINKSGRQIDFETLKSIVDEDDKCRFSFNEDLTQIRANQGHTIPVEVAMTQSVPPNVLYHGTADKYIESIKQNGIIRKSRQYVHLSKDRETAIKVGMRHGSPIVLTIDTGQMIKDGYKFFISSNSVWQSPDIPFKYVIKIETITH